MVHSYVSCRGTVSASAIHMEDVVCKDESTPIVVVIPGLTSDSSSAVSYVNFSLRLFLMLLLSSSLYNLVGTWKNHVYVPSL